MKMDENNSVYPSINENESQERYLKNTRDSAVISSGSSSKQSVTVDNDKGSFSKYLQMRQSQTIKINCFKNTDQTKSSVVQNINNIVHKIANTVNLFENGVINSSNKKKSGLILSCSQKEKDFVSFDTLSQEISCSDDIFQNNIHTSNSMPKFESQWGCETQLAALADNADAILNLADCKEITQTYDLDDSFHEPFTENVNNKKTSNTENNTTNSNKNLGNEISLKLISTASNTHPKLEIGAAAIVQKKSDLSESNDLNILNNDIIKNTLIFKIPKLVEKSPRANKANIKLDRSKYVQNNVGTVSTPSDQVTKPNNTESNLEPSLFPSSKSDDCCSAGSSSNNTKTFVGFTTASNKKINISEDAIKNAQKWLQSVNQDDPSIPVTDSKFEDQEITVKFIHKKPKECKNIVKNNCGHQSKNNNARRIPDSTFDKKNYHISIEEIADSQNVSSHPPQNDDLTIVVDAMGKENIDKRLTNSPIIVVDADEWESFCSSVKSQINEEDFEPKTHDEITIEQEVTDSDDKNSLNLANFPTGDEDNCCSPIIVSQFVSKNSRQNSRNINIQSQYSEMPPKDLFLRDTTNQPNAMGNKKKKSARKLFIEELRNVAIHKRIPSDICEGTLIDKLSSISDDNTSLNHTTSSHFDDLDSKEQSVKITSNVTISEKKDVIDNDNLNNFSASLSSSLCTTLTYRIEDDISETNITNTFSNDDTFILESMKDSSNSEKCETIVEGVSSAVSKSDNDYKLPEVGSSLSNFTGFHTASNKEIKISTEALNAAKILFQNTDDKNDLRNAFVENDYVSGSLIGSPSENKFIYCTTEKVDISENTTNLATQAPGEQLKGFCTASNKVIPISDKALSAAFDLFKDVDMEDQLDKKILSSDIIFPINSTPKEVLLQSTESWEPTLKSNNSFDVGMSGPIIENIHPFDSDSILEKSFSLEQFDSFDDKDGHLRNSDMNKPKNVLQKTNCCDGSQNNSDVIDSNLFGSSFTDVIPPLPNSFCKFTTSNNEVISVSNEAMEIDKNVHNGPIFNVDIKNCVDGLSVRKSSTDNSAKLITHSAITSEDRIELSDENLNETRSYAEKQSNENYTLKIDGKCTKVKNIESNAICDKLVDVFEKLSDEINSFQNIPVCEWNEDVFHIKQSENISHSPQEITKTDKSVKIKQTSDDNNIDASGENLTMKKNESYSPLVTAEFKDNTDKNTIIKDISGNDMDVFLPHKKFEGFKTASNKTIQLSAKALDAAKKLFSSIDDEKSTIGDSILEDEVFGLHSGITDRVSIERNVCLSDVIDDTNNDAVKCIQDSDKNAIHTNVGIYEMTSKENVSFNGFQTASNKIIKVSSKSLQTAKNIFKDLVLEDNKKENADILSRNFVTKEVSSMNERKKFHTTSNSTVPDTSKHIANMKGTSPEDNFVDKELNMNNIDHIVRTFDGSHKVIPVSNKAIQGAKSIFKDIPEKNIFKDDDAIPGCSKDEILFINNYKGFQTAGKISIAISNEALDTAKDIGDSSGNAISNNEDKFPFKSWEKEIASTSKFQGFQTASNKIIPVSNKAINAAKIIFEDIENMGDIPGNISMDKNNSLSFNIDEISTIQNIERDSNFHDSHTFEINSSDEIVLGKTEFQGFQTASNKNISVSLEAINEAKMLFENIPERADFEYLFPVSSAEEKVISMDRFEGFKTGNNKIIPISEKAINAAKCIFKDINPIDDHNGDVFNVNPIEKVCIPVNKSQGFLTTSNTSNQVSKKVINTTKSIFKGTQSSDNIEKENKLDNDFIFEIIPSDPSELVNTNKFQGFQTASNKSIPISSKAINAAKSIFKDLEDSDIPGKTILKDDDQYPIKYPQNNGSSSIKFQGFQTANNKVIPVSSKSIKAAKIIFQDIDDTNNIASQTILEHVNIFKLTIDNEEVTGFHSANNNKIKVSEKAVLVGSNTFDDIDSENRLKKESEIADGNKFVSQAHVPFAGFMTASSKKVTISETAMLNARGIFDGIDETISDINPQYRARKTKSSDFDESSTGESKKIKPSSEISENTENDSGRFKKKNAIPSLGSLAKKTLKSYDNFLSGAENSNENSEDINSNIDTQGKISFVNHKKFDKALIPTKDESIYTVNEFKTEFMQPTLGKRKSSTKNGQIQSVSDTENPTKKQCLTSSFMGLTQEISDCAIAFLADEDATVIMDPKTCESSISNETDTISDTCTSPILKFKNNPKKKKVFKVPYRKIGNVEDTDVDFEIMLSQKTPQVKSDVINEETPKTSKILKKVEDLNLDIMLGDLYNEKLNRGNNKIHLKDLKRVRLENKTSRDILDLTPENCLNFIFDRCRIDVKLDSTDTKISVSFLVDLFQKHSNIDKKLIPNGWILNHIKWIMWKLAVYERSFDCFGTVVLTVSNVLKQLKYRYDRELFKTERPILRKILEKDDIASRRMILCVARIIKIPLEKVVSEAKNVASDCQFEIELTDGWYSVIATIDKILCNAIVKKKIEIGTKLLVYGAELTNCQDGKSPLEDLSLVRLKIHANGCRRVRHFEKLGAGISRPPPFYPIPAAGPAPTLTIAIVKVYPPLHIEKMPSGDTVTRSDKLEQIHSAKMESEVQSRVENLYSQVEKELSKQSDKMTKNKLTNLALLTKANASGEELATMMESAADPQDFMSSLTNTQNDMLREAMLHRSAELRDRIDTRVRTMMEDLGVTSTRKVITVHKARAVVLKPDKSRLKREMVIGMLTLWRPDESVIQVVREGAYLDVYGATPTGIRLGELHLSANKRTVFREVPNKNYSEIFPDLEKLKRKCTFIREINQQNFSPDFNEIDTIGFVFKIVPSRLDLNAVSKTNDPITTLSNVQTVYIADEFTNFMAINFWGGLCKFGYEKVIEVGVFLACSNLQHRPKTSKKRIMHLYATEFSLFTQCPRKAHFVDSLRNLEAVINAKGVTNYIDECCISLNDLFQKPHLKTIVSFQNDSSSSSSNVFSKTDINRLFDQSESNNKSSISSRNFIKGNTMKENINENSLSGLDFDTTFVESTLNSFNNTSVNSSFKLHNNSSLNWNNSYSSLKDSRSSAAEMRIDRLKKYGEPPALSPLVLNVSNNLKKEFIVPKFDLTTEKSQPSVKINVLGNQDDLKRKYNEAYIQDDFFDNCDNQEDKESHFKEDFVYSPPLSLE